MMQNGEHCPGMLRKSLYESSYLYFSYEARVVSLEDSIYDIGQNSYAEEKAGFLKDFSSQGFVISSQHMRDDKRQVIACTYLIYVEKNSDGEKIDRWLPVRAGGVAMALSSCKL